MAVLAGFLLPARLQAVSLNFSKVYIGTATNTAASDEPSSVAIGLPSVPADGGVANFTFTSYNAADLTFNGNDVGGVLNMGTLGTYVGTMSRRSKTGSTSDAFYFYESVETIGSPNSLSQTPVNGGKNFLIIVPGREAKTSNNASVSISSDPIDSALNALLPSNVAPVVTTSGGTTAASEQVAIAIDASITVTDADSATLASGTVEITGSFVSGQDVLSFTNDGSTMGDIAASYDSSSGLLTMTSASGASPVQWQAAMRAVTYKSNSDTPNTSDRTISFQANDGGLNSNIATKTVSVTAVNDAPVVTTSAGTTASTEQVAVAIDGSLTVTDADSVNLASATVSITGNFQSAEDVLAFTNVPATMGGISGSYNSATGVLTLTGPATVAQFQAAMRAVTYTNTADAPNVAIRTVSFQVNDGALISNVGTKTVSVAAVNDAPQGGKLPGTGATDPNYNVGNGRYELTTPEDTPISGQVKAYDPDGDSLTYSKLSEPAHGTVTVNADGTYTYTPALNYNGTDSFTILVSDGNGGTTTITVFITVTPVNDAPVAGRNPDGTSDPAYNAAAGNYQISTPEDTPVAGRVKAYDVDGDTLSYTAGNPPGNGTVVVNPDGSYVYTPKPNFNGQDSFTVTVSDGKGGVISIVVVVTVTPVNDAPDGGKNSDGTVDPSYNPVAGRYEISTPEDTPISGRVKAYDADGDPLTYAKASEPQNGTVTVNSDGTYTYTPKRDFNGNDSFTVTVSDGKGGTALITVAVTVTPVNDTPVPGKLPSGAADPNFNPTAGRYEIITGQDRPISGRVNAFDLDGDRLTFATKTPPANGSVVVNPDGTYTYTPARGFNGEDRFVILVSDGNGGTAEIIVVVRVSAAPVNTVPNGPLKFRGEPARVVGPDGSVFRVADVDSNELTIELSCGHGLLTLPVRTGLQLVKGAGSNDTVVSFRGTKEAINAALAQLVYQPLSGYFGLDTIAITSVDESNNSDIDRIDPPFTVELVTLGGNNANASVASLASQGKTVVSSAVTSFDSSLIRGAQIVGDGPVGRLAIGTPLRQDGSVQETTVKVELAYADGSKETFDVKVTIYNPKLELVTQLRLNPQTSLYEQRLQVTNTTPFVIDSFRVIVPTLPAGVSLYSRSTTTSDGRAAIEDLRPMQPNEVRVLVVEYFAPNVQRFSDPALVLEINTFGGISTPVGTNSPVDRVVVGASNRTYVEFATQSGRTYFVQYRDGASGVWQTSPVAVNGTGSTIHWLDEGMPKTLTPPTAAREYRLLVTNGIAAPLVITSQPQSAQIDSGGSTSLRIAMGAGGPYTYQWYRDGVAISGATASTFAVANAALANEGDYHVVVSDGRSSLQSQTASIKIASNNPGRIVNLSVRAQLEASGAPLITGFVMQGSGSRPVLVRAVGDTLASFGVQNAVRDTALKLYRGQNVFSENDDWTRDSETAQTRSASANVGAFALAETAKDAALVRRLLAEPYTIHALNQTAQEGIVLVEMYDALGAHDPSSRIANVSARARVSGGDGVLIAGLVVAGNTTCRLMARVVGPTLSSFGVTGVLADPTLELYASGASTPIATNDDWASVQSAVVGEGLFRRVGAFDLPAGSRDSVIVTRIQPGAYTLVAQGKGAAQGQALIEIYLID